MTIPREVDVRRIITPEREAKFWCAHEMAWADVMADIGKYSRWPRSRANMMFERLAVRLQEEFADEHPKVRFYFAAETVKTILDETLLVRCKKADDQGLGHNIETGANTLFCVPERDMFGFSGFQKVEIVYVLNRFGTAIRNIMVQARDGDVKLWAYPMNRPAAVAAPAPVVSLPPRPPMPPSDGSELVQPRKKPAAKPDTDEK